MPDFQTDVLDKIARIVGGTVTTVDPTFFSGAMANGGLGDGTGVAGLTGCYSTTPDGLQGLPVAIVIADDFKADLASLGEEDNEDNVRLLILVSSEISESQMKQLTPYRDSVPAAFRAHMQATFSGTPAPNAADFFITNGRSGVHLWGEAEYLAWDFTVRVRRMVATSYSP
jgi:hypothetical protein